MQHRPAASHSASSSLELPQLPATPPKGCEDLSVASGSRVARALQAEYPPSNSDALVLLKLLSMAAGGVGSHENVLESLSAGARVAEVGPPHKGVMWKVPLLCMRRCALRAIAILHVTGTSCFACEHHYCALLYYTADETTAAVRAPE